MRRLIVFDQVVVIPIILGQGRTMFPGVQDRLPLTLTRTRAFRNGNVLPEGKGSVLGFRISLISR